MRETIISKLALFHEELGPKQEASIQHGKKLLLDLKHSCTMLTSKQEQYVKTCREAAEDIALMAPAYIPDTVAETDDILRQVSRGDPNTGKLKIPEMAMNPGSMTPPQRRKLGGRRRTLELRTLTRTLKPNPNPNPNLRATSAGSKYLRIGLELPAMYLSCEICMYRRGTGGTDVAFSKRDHTDQRIRRTGVY